MRLQKRVRAAERTAAEKAIMRRQRRGVCGFDDTMPPALAYIFHKRSLLLCIGTPEDEHDWPLLTRHHFDHRICELLPAAPLMACRLAHLYRQHAVQQQHALLRPMREVAVAWRIDAKIGSQLLVYIDEAWRRTHPALH